jgi:acylphosphatase
MDATKRFSVKGKVKKLDTSMLEIVIKGDANQVNRFMDWCNNFDGGVVTEYKFKYNNV